MDESAQIHGGGNTVKYSCIQGLTGYAGNGNTGDDPEFADPLGPDWIGATLDDNLRLTSGSPAVDAGSNALAAGLTEDMDGLLRFWDDPGTPDTGVGADPNDPIVDMGAYELQPTGCFFADANLKAAVEEDLGITDPTPEDMLNLITLHANGKNIESLVGLECAENLSTAYLYSNKITDIEPLMQLCNLTYLHLAYNQIEVLPDDLLICQEKIRVLYLYRNNISNIEPLTSIKSDTLTHLHIQDNAELPVEAYKDYIPAIKANNPNLRSFIYDYGCEPMLAGDRNKDCTFNLADLAIMGSDWLRCTHIYQELCP